MPNDSVWREGAWWVERADGTQLRFDPEREQWREVAPAVPAPAWAAALPARGIGGAAGDWSACDDAAQRAKGEPAAKLIVLAAVAVVASAALALGIASTRMDSDAHDSTNAASAHAYPPSYRKNFINACLITSGGQRAYCECALTAVQARFTASEAIAMEDTYRRTQKMPREFVAVAEECRSNRTGAGA